MRKIVTFVLLAAAAGVTGSVPAASAACTTAAQGPSVWVTGGISNSGVYVESCDVLTCGGAVASTPALSVPGVAAVGPTYVNDCA